MAKFTPRQVAIGSDPRRAHLDDREPLKKAAENANSRLIWMMDEENKQPKLAVDYQPACSSARCGRCENGIFEPGKSTGTCRQVAGDVDEGGWCELFFHRQNLSRHPAAEAAELAQPGAGPTEIPAEPAKGTTAPTPVSPSNA